MGQLLGHGTKSWLDKNFFEYVQLQVLLHTLLNLVILAVEFLIFRGQIQTRRGYRGCRR